MLRDMIPATDDFSSTCVLSLCPPVSLIHPSSLCPLVSFWFSHHQSIWFWFWNLPPTTNSFKLVFSSFLHHSTVSAWARTHANNQCTLLVSVCMLSCGHCHFLALYPYWDCERDAERKTRGKEERQGNKGKPADARPISFTNMQILLPLWHANERLQSAN